ncbi:hypothetical protein ACHAXN_004046 [Cyclotella atomus]
MKATKKFFPYKLYRLLETIEETSTDDVAACIMWLPHGRAFIVRNEDVFVSKVLSAHFKQTRLRSFTRQLLLWGFKRILDGPDRGSWYHSKFLRGKPSSLALVKRTAIKSNVTETSTGHSSILGNVITPNFCEMPSIELDTPEEAMKALGKTPSDDDGAPKPFVYAKASKNLPLIAGHGMIPNLSGWLNPVLTMQRPLWINTSPAMFYPYLNRMGHVSYPCIPSGCEGLSASPLKSEGLPNGLANQDEELKQLAEWRFPTAVPNSNQNDFGLNALVLGTDDLVVKAIQYAFRDMPSPRVRLFKSYPHLMTQDNSMASVHLSFSQHIDPMQGVNQQDCFAFGSHQYQQHQDVALPPIEEFPYSTSFHSAASFSTSEDFSISLQKEEVHLNEIAFDSNQQLPELGLNLEEDDELVQFIDGALSDDGEWP